MRDFFGLPDTEVRPAHTCTRFAAPPVPTRAQPPPLTRALRVPQNLLDDSFICALYKKIMHQARPSRRWERISHRALEPRN
jgi:hypothetical protein